MLKFKSALLCAGVSLLLSACAVSNATDVKKKLTFAPYGLASLNVALIDVVNNYKATDVDGHKEADISPSLEEGVRQLVDERLEAKGNDGALTLTINEASIIEERLPQSEGVQSYFTKQVDKKYNGRVELLLNVNAPKRNLSGEFKIVAERSMTLLEGSTLAERDAVLFNLTEQMLLDVNSEIDNLLAGGLKPLTL